MCGGEDNKHTNKPWGWLTVPACSSDNKAAIGPFFPVLLELTWSGEGRRFESLLLFKPAAPSSANGRRKPSLFEFSDLLFPRGMTHTGIKDLVRLLHFVNECSASQTPGTES